MEEKTYGSMDDALYFNNLALNCLETTTNNIVALLNQNIQGRKMRMNGFSSFIFTYLSQFSQNPLNFPIE